MSKGTFTESVMSYSGRAFIANNNYVTKLLFLLFNSGSNDLSLNACYSALGTKNTGSTLLSFPA